MMFLPFGEASTFSAKTCQLAVAMPGFYFSSSLRTVTANAEGPGTHSLAPLLKRLQNHHLKSDAFSERNVSNSFGELTKRHLILAPDDHDTVPQCRSSRESRQGTLMDSCEITNHKISYLEIITCPR